MTKPLQIAIDGPVGAGKSTIAKMVAEKLGLTYVYTGAMYRAVALFVRRQGIVWEDREAVEKAVGSIVIDLQRPEPHDTQVVRVLLFGEDVTEEVFDGELGEGASVVSQYPRVRAVLVAMQRRLAAGKAVIMDGRDIGTHVLPHAPLKIYMDADVDERVRRKQQQLHLKLTQARSDVLTRDRREMSRTHDPLRPAKDAWILDTTDYSVEQVVEMIIERVRKMGFDSSLLIV